MKFVSRIFAKSKLKSISKKATQLFALTGVALSVALPAMPKVSAASFTPTAKVSFTFDDGLDSAARYADPILKAAGFTGTDYVISGCVGMTTVPNTCHANPDTPYMTWAQIAQLKADGWEIGDHTVDHPCLASNATTDPEDCPATSLTPAQVNAELVNSQTAIAGQTGGVTPIDFASPYGDWTPPVLSEIAKVMASHRGFADTIDQNGDGVIDHGNTFPYNDYLLYDLQVQGDGTIAGGTSVAQIKSMIDQTKTNKQWLVLTFHNVLPTASADPSNYEYSTANFQTIVNYVKTSGLPVVNVSNGLVTNAGNLLPNASFNTALSSNTVDQTVWSTDSPTIIKQDTGANGNYPDPTNSVLLGSTTKDASLFSPVVPVDSTKTYVLKNYLNIAAMSVAAGHQIAFYIDEYDANGNALPTRLMRTEVGNAGSTVGAWVESLNFEYKPSGTNVTKARMRVVVTANSATRAYLDNVQWFAEDGSTTSTPTPTPAPTPGKGGSGIVPVYRMYNPGSHDHYYTADESKRAFAKTQAGFVDDGIAFYGSLTPQAGMVPIYSMYNGRLTDHWLTQDGIDRYWGINFGGYLDEGVAFYAYPTAQAGSAPVYQMWQGGYGDHFYSDSDADRVWSLLFGGFTYDKVAFYAIP